MGLKKMKKNNFFHFGPQEKKKSVVKIFECHYCSPLITRHSPLVAE